jgi:hypothetical protein
MLTCRTIQYQQTGEQGKVRRRVRSKRDGDRQGPTSDLEPERSWPTIPNRTPTPRGSFQMSAFGMWLTGSEGQICFTKSGPIPNRA